MGRINASGAKQTEPVTEMEWLKNGHRFGKDEGHSPQAEGAKHCQRVTSPEHNQTKGEVRAVGESHTHIHRLVVVARVLLHLRDDRGEAGHREPANEMKIVAEAETPVMKSGCAITT